MLIYSFIVSNNCIMLIRIYVYVYVCTAIVNSVK